MSEQRASDVQSHSLESKHMDLMYKEIVQPDILASYGRQLTAYRNSLLKSLSIHAREHFPASTFSVFPTSADSVLAILLAANKYSPSNFW